MLLPAVPTLLERWSLFMFLLFHMWNVWTSAHFYFTHSLTVYFFLELWDISEVNKYLHVYIALVYVASICVKLLQCHEECTLGQLYHHFTQQDLLFLIVLLCKYCNSAVVWMTSGVWKFYSLIASVGTPNTQSRKIKKL